MPLFEYRCGECARKFAKLVGMTADSSTVACPKCGSENVTKLISRFTRGKGEDALIDSLDDEAFMAGDDPKRMSRLMRDIGSELADDGDDFEEALDEAEREIYDGPGDTEE